MQDHAILQRRACVLFGVDPKTVRCEQPHENLEIRTAMQEITALRRRLDYHQIGVLPEHKGILMNPKRIHRLYQEKWQAVWHKRGRKRARGTRTPMPLAVIDDRCRENLCLTADTSISDARIACELAALVRIYGRLSFTVSDKVLCQQRTNPQGDRSRGIPSD